MNSTMPSDVLAIADKSFSSRLFTGTGKYASNETMLSAIAASQSQLVTLALKRMTLADNDSNIFAALLKLPQISLLPNTSGAKNAKEAVHAALLARDALETNWIKLEIHPDVKYLMPDPIETLAAASQLVELGFVVLPYVHADPVLCKRLESVGCAAVMPLGSPIGSNNGLQTKAFLEIIIEQATVPVIVDAGIGSPADAAMAMELGADAVLVNTAMAVATNSTLMATAFAQAVTAGRNAYLAGINRSSGSFIGANASSPLTAFLS